MLIDAFKYNASSLSLKNYREFVDLNSKCKIVQDESKTEPWPEGNFSARVGEFRLTAARARRSKHEDVWKYEKEKKISGHDFPNPRSHGTLSTTNKDTSHSQRKFRGL